jgi:osmoprotectant transport system ATP-binding protein
VGGILEQYDSPANILSEPENEFIEDFVGADRSLKRLNLIRVEEVMDKHPLLVKNTQSVEEAINIMREKKTRFSYVVDGDMHLMGYIDIRDIKGKSGWVDDFIEPSAAAIMMGTTLRDALSEMLVVDYANICVIDENKRVRGLVNTQMVQEAVTEGETVDADEED